MKKEQRKISCEHFSRRLRDSMQAKGLISTRSSTGINASELAKASKCSKQMCQRYIAGDALPEPEVISAIADWLEVSPGWLLFGDNIKGQQSKHCITINTEVLRHILSKISLLYKKEDYVDELVDFTMDVINDVNHLIADNALALQIVDVIVGSVQRFDPNNLSTTKAANIAKVANTVNEGNAQHL